MPNTLDNPPAQSGADELAEKVCGSDQTGNCRVEAFLTHPQADQTVKQPVRRPQESDGDHQGDDRVSKHSHRKNRFGYAGAAKKQPLERERHQSLASRRRKRRKQDDYAGCLNNFMCALSFCNG